MKYSKLIRPFTGGMITDVPAHSLGPIYSPYAQDGFSPEGVFTQRQGWEYDGTTADVAANLFSATRNKFILAATTLTITSANTSLYIHNSSASGTAVGTLNSNGTYLPRCVYDDQVVFCAQDGTTGVHLYSGASLTFGAATTVSTTTGQGIVTATSGTFPTGATPGAYKALFSRATANSYPFLSARITERSSSTSLTLEDVKFSAGEATFTEGVNGLGQTAPCVNIYNTGTGTFNASDTFTGVGTRWFTNGITGAGDSLLAHLADGTYSLHYINNGGVSDTTLDVNATDKSDANISYQILRSCPFKDAASHKGSFWGTGVKQYPNRVYVGPPGWNLSFPPGFPLPFDPSVLPTSTNPNDFLMDFVDVPSSSDGDDNIAILSSPNPLLVLKRNAVYGVYGSYPNFSVDMVADGIGCIDIRSAHSYDEGQFWAGEGGIYWYTGGRIIDLTDGRINREWRNLTRDFDYGTSDYCTLGVSQGHLIVHITTAGGTIQRTYLCDLRSRSWQSRISNFTPRYLSTSRIPGETERLYGVSDARQGRVLDFAPALDRSGTAKDDAGSAPRLIAYTPEGIDGEDIDADTRMVDASVHANVYDAGAAGSTSMAVSVVSQDSLTSPTTGTKTLADIDSDTTDRLDRHYFRSVNRRGRRHQIRLEVDTLGTDANATKVEVHQIDATFRTSRTRT